MAYTTLKYGSRGSSVSELQKLLNQNGYSLSVDGIYGKNTQQAVRDYQTRTGLSVDGIAGNNTWGALTGNGGSGGLSYSQIISNVSGGSSPGGSSSASYLSQYESGKPTYSPSQALKDAEALLKDWEGKKPGPYQSSYADQIQEVLDKIMNREKFSYDFASDPLYQQMAERYQQQGKMAMMDAMGDAAALTGGYGSSYGQQVGQQTYQGYLQGLNDAIPELRDAAYQVYQDEGDRMYENANLLQGLENTEYGRYRDTVQDYYNDLNYYYTKYNDMSADEYNRYVNDLSAWQADRAYYYQKSQDELAQSNWEREFALAQAQAAAKGSGGGGRSSSKNAADYGLTYGEAGSILFSAYKSDGYAAAKAALEDMNDMGYIGNYTYKQQAKKLDAMNNFWKQYTSGNYAAPKNTHKSSGGKDYDIDMDMDMSKWRRVSQTTRR